MEWCKSSIRSLKTSILPNTLIPDQISIIYCPNSWKLIFQIHSYIEI